MNCIYCGSSKIRTSRFRLKDLVRLLLFQFPVRCRACNERDYAGFLLVLNLRQAEKVHRDEARRSKRRRTKVTDTGEQA